MDTDSGQPMIGKYSFVDKGLIRVSRKGNDRESDSTDESREEDDVLEDGHGGNDYDTEDELNDSSDDDSHWWF